MCTIINPYNPAMPQKPDPVPPKRLAVRPAVRPRPDSIIQLNKVFAAQTPEQIERQHETTRARRLAKVVKPCAPENKTVVMIAREYTPPQTDLQKRILEICNMMGREEIDHHEAHRLMMEAIIAPSRVRIVEATERFQHQLAELEADYYGNIG